MATTTLPAIILVRPQMGENIGAAARAMHNFGLPDLRIVAPRDGWPNAAAQAMAARGVEIVDNAKIYTTTREAIADLQWIAATTARPRNLNKPVITPVELAGAMRVEEGDGKTGILFGRESSGLDNEDIAVADAILQIPTAPENPSLNIAQAVVVVAYECFRQTHLSAAAIATTTQSVTLSPRGKEPLASKDELQGLFDQLETALDAADYWREADKKAKMWLNLRSLLTRARMNSQEVRSMRGLIRALRS